MRPALRKLISGLSGLSLAWCAVAPLAAQEQPRREGGMHRTLGDHRFIPNSFIRNPFVQTYLRNGLGGGITSNLLVTVEVPNKPPVTVGGDLLFLNLDMEFQALLTKWLAIRFGGSGLARLGTSFEALLTEGASGGYGTNYGATVRVFESKRLALSAIVDGSSSSLYGVTPLDYARALVNGNSSPDSLLQNTSGSTIYGGASLAYTPARWLGLTGVFRAGSVDQLGGGERSGATEVAVLGDVDFKTVSSIPIGITLGYRHQSKPERAGDVSSGGISSYGWGLFYTARRDFSVGVEGEYFQLSQRESQRKYDAFSARLVTRLDF